MSLAVLLQRSLIFVGGKGGVGKTTCAGALALAAAERGKRCLLVSTDPAHSLGDVFGVEIGDRERVLAPQLSGLEIDPQAQADRHIATIKDNMRALVAPAMFSEIERQMEMARLAPGVVEAALMERVSELMDVERQDYDLVIFDTAPTGHTLRLLSLPEIMMSWTDGLLRRKAQTSRLSRVLARLGGDRRSTASEVPQIAEPEDLQGNARDERIHRILLERRRKFHRARRLLLDPEVSAFVLVTIPEKLPILESKKALDALRKFRVPVAAGIINRELPAEVSDPFLVMRRRQEQEYLAQIETLFAELKRIHVPLQPRDVHGLDDLRALGSLLTSES